MASYFRSRIFGNLYVFYIFWSRIFGIPFYDLIFWKSICFHIFSLVFLISYFGNLYVLKYNSAFIERLNLQRYIVMKLVFDIYRGY